MDRDGEGYVEVMYNAAYGGFSFSEEAKRLYCEDRGIAMLGMNFYEMKRTDPCMIKLVKELKQKVNSTFSNIQLEKIEKKYENFFSIEEYDGYESVSIDYKGFKLDEIRRVMDDEALAWDVKEKKIRRILNSREEEE